METKSTDEGKDLYLAYAIKQDSNTTDTGEKGLHGAVGMSSVWCRGCRNKGSHHVDMLICQQVLERTICALQYENPDMRFNKRKMGYKQPTMNRGDDDTGQHGMFGRTLGAMEGKK